MAERVPIKQQALSVERAAANLGGHVNNLRVLVGKGKRPAHELETAQQRLPDLRAAAATLHFIANHEAAYRALIEQELKA